MDLSERQSFERPGCQQGLKSITLGPWLCGSPDGTYTQGHTDRGGEGGGEGKEGEQEQREQGQERTTSTGARPDQFASSAPLVVSGLPLAGSRSVLASCCLSHN